MYKLAQAFYLHKTGKPVFNPKEMLRLYLLNLEARAIFNNIKRGNSRAIFQNL